MRSLLLITLLTLTSQFALAAGNGPVVVDWSYITLQLINFVVFLGVIGYLGAKFLPNVMANFKEEYLTKASAAKERFEEAKRTKEDLEKKLRDLELNYDETLEKARAEARDLSLLKLSKAEKQASLMDKDLEDQILSLKRSYWLEVKTSLINQAVSELKNEFSDKVDPVILQKLQDDFVNKMSARVS